MVDWPSNNRSTSANLPTWNRYCFHPAGNSSGNRISRGGDATDASAGASLLCTAPPPLPGDRPPILRVAQRKSVGATHLGDSLWVALRSPRCERCGDGGVARADSFSAWYPSSFTPRGAVRLVSMVIRSIPCPGIRGSATYFTRIFAVWRIAASKGGRRYLKPPCVGDFPFSGTNSLHVQSS